MVMYKDGVQKTAKNPQTIVCMDISEYWIPAGASVSQSVNLEGCERAIALGDLTAPIFCAIQVCSLLNGVWVGSFATEATTQYPMTEIGEIIGNTQIVYFKNNDTVTSYINQITILGQ